MEEMVVRKDAVRRQQDSGESEHEERKVESEHEKEVESEYSEESEEVESEYSEESEEVESESDEERDKEHESERAGEEGNSEWLKELSHGVYDESEMQRKKEKEHKSREQKRRASQKFAVAEARPDPLDCGADQLRKAQAEDTTLKGVWKNLHNGDLGYVLHRKCRKDGKWTDEEEALVLPKAYRNRVLEASHSAVYAGHLGRDNTLAKIKRLYYWPGMATAVRRMCRSCPTCQKATKRK